jgi:hypothetical protein
VDQHDPRALAHATEPFFVPLGDEVLIDGPANLKFTNEIRRVCEAINAGRRGGERRFYEYAEDLPGWPECFEPLWLSQEEDERLRGLGIVAAKATNENS